MNAGRGMWGLVMRLLGAVLAAALLVLSACSSEPGEPGKPPVPATVAELDPCTLLTSEEQADLHLKVNDRADEGSRRSCTFFTTDNTLGSLDERRANAIDMLDITIRSSAAPNRVADAKRVAETYQRERQAKITPTKVAGRDVYVVGPARPIGCPFLFQVNATSSVEVAATLSNGAPRCTDPTLTRLIAAKLPAPDPTPAHADHDRPADILEVNPCTLLPDAKRTALHLRRGQFSADVTPMCLYDTGATHTGALEALAITVQTFGAKPADSDKNYTGTVLAVNGRTAYEVRDPQTTTSTCDYVLEVTRATSVRVSATTLGADSIEKSCQSTAILAADIEPRLPLIVA